MRKVLCGIVGFILMTGTVNAITPKYSAIDMSENCTIEHTYNQINVRFKGTHRMKSADINDYNQYMIYCEDEGCNEYVVIQINE